MLLFPVLAHTAPWLLRGLPPMLSRASPAPCRTRRTMPETLGPGVRQKHLKPQAGPRPTAPPLPVPRPHFHSYMVPLFTTNPEKKPLCFSRTQINLGRANGVSGHPGRISVASTSPRVCSCWKGMPHAGGGVSRRAGSCPAHLRGY